MWTRFCIDDTVPTQYAASTGLYRLRKYQVSNKRCVSSSLMIVARVQTLVSTRSNMLASYCSFPIIFSQHSRKKSSTYVCTWFVSDLALAKFKAVGKTSAPSRRTLQLNCTGCTGHILRGQVAIITKPSPPFLVCDVIMVPGLLPFLSTAARDWPGNEARVQLQLAVHHND